MPHAESDMSSNMTNGDKPSSTLGHIKSYPVVSDTIDAVKSNPYGAKSFELADAAYDRFAKPVEPYLRGPYSYAKPYVEKADSLGNAGLERIDDTFPIVKKDTQTVVDSMKGYIVYPFETAGQGRDYLYNTWNEQYNKTIDRNGGSGLITLGLASLSTFLTIQVDIFNKVSDYLGPKRESFKERSESFIDGAKKKKDAYADEARSQKDTYANKAQNKADEVSAKAQENMS